MLQAITLGKGLRWAKAGEESSRERVNTKSFTTATRIPAFGLSQSYGERAKFQRVRGGILPFMIKDFLHDEACGTSVEALSAFRKACDMLSCSTLRANVHAQHLVRPSRQAPRPHRVPHTESIARHSFPLQTRSSRQLNLTRCGICFAKA